MKCLSYIGATAALFSLASPAGPAKAQCRLCSPVVELGQVDPVRTPVAINVETRLDFDRLILTGSGGGSARLSPAGETATGGAVSGVRGRAMVGSIVIRGEPGRAISVDLPSAVELFGSDGRRLSIRRITSDLPADPRLDAAGRLTFRIGGELQISGDADGEYRGEVPIMVQYL